MMSLFSFFSEQLFQSTGFWVVDSFFNGSYLDELSVVLGQKASRKSGQAVEGASEIYRSEPRVDALLTKAGFPSTSLLQSRFQLRVVHDQYVVKPPGVELDLPWHQDSAYYGDGDTLTAYIALSENHPPDNPLEVVIGSHLSGSQPHQNGAVTNAAQFDMHKTRVELARGSVFFGHAHLVHRGCSNMGIKPSASYSLVLAKC